MMSDAAVIWTMGLSLGTLATLPVVLRMRRQERETDEAEARALEYGLHEPVSLHPVVDPDLCIGTGSCVDVCPEGKVIGFRRGQGVVIAPASCIGHGLCERSCPVGAISLVFGTSSRGVELPRIKEDFETNVPGLYIVGELGGMGLIRNAFEQGRQCVAGIAAKPDAKGNGDLLDLVIVGAGPAGIAASLHARKAGLRFVTLEREPDAGGAVRHYPRKKLVMTSPVKVPGFGRIGSREMLKEELIELWDRITGGLPIHTNCSVKVVHRAGDGFAIETNRHGYHTRRVILAVGRRGMPRKLNIPGEELDNVQYSLAEPEAFRGDRVLVVGGGDSAVEAALALSEEPNTEVRLSYRQDRFSRIKPANRERIGSALERGALDIVWKSHVTCIERDRVWMTTPDTGFEPRSMGNDQVFVFAGGVLPTGFLRSCGVDIETKFGTA